MHFGRIPRLLKLLQALQAGKGQNPDDIARTCRVSRRTVFRDLETLRSAGVPFEFDKDEGRYSIASDYFLPTTNFTPSEALALLVLGGRLGGNRGLPFMKPARDAALKLQRSLSAPLRKQLTKITKSISLRFEQVNPLKGQEPVYEQLVVAIAKRRAVVIDYVSSLDWNVFRTKLRPYHLFFNQHSWYVAGRSSRHKDVWTFNVGRIKSLTVTDEKYAMPRGWSLDRYLGNAWNLVPEPGPDVRVSVRFTPFVAHGVAAVAWHRTQRCDFLPDGSLEFSATVSGLNEIAWWILGYGDQAEVLRPRRLRRLIAHRATNMSALYADDAIDHSPARGALFGRRM
jgi:predicted DNA-binding transcriptional regulator YafY